jgi:hypothetical protein
MTPDPTSKRHLIKKLDDEYRAKQVAYNQAYSALNYVHRLDEDSYRRKRTHIINSDDHDDLHVHA